MSPLSSFAAIVQPGERIEYKITKVGIKAGEASLTFAGPRIYRGKKIILIVFQAKAFNFLDEERIFVNPKDYFPLFVERNLNIFGKKEKILEEYSPGHIKITKGKEKQVIDKGGTVDNIYAFIYRYRQQGSFKIGEVLNIPLPTKDVKVKVVKQETISAARQKYESFYLESEDGSYKIWFDASTKKIPLRINGAVKLANADMVMTKYEK